MTSRLMGKFFTSLISSSSIVVPSVITFQYIMKEDDSSFLDSSISDNISFKKKSLYEPNMITPKSKPVVLIPPPPPPPKPPKEIDDLGIPTSCNADQVENGKTQECELTKEQLKKVQFESGEGSTIEIDGLENTDDKVILTIEGKQSDTKNYPKGKKYNFKAKSGNVTIRNTKDGEISITKDKEVVFREKQGESKLEKAPEEVDDLGIPTSCNADQVENGKTQECELTKDQLNKVQFEPKSGSTIEINGLENTDDKVILTIEGKQSDVKNYPKGKKYNFKTKSGTVTIKNAKGGEVEITEKGVDFKENEKKLEKDTSSDDIKKDDGVDNLGIPKSCKAEEVSLEFIAGCELTKNQLEKIKFETKDKRTQIQVLSMDNDDKVHLLIKYESDDVKTYPKKKKYTFSTYSGDGSSSKNIYIAGIKGHSLVYIIKDYEVNFREKENEEKLELVPYLTKREMKKEKLWEIFKDSFKEWFENSKKVYGAWWKNKDGKWY